MLLEHRALSFATNVHMGQVDKLGEPYMLHVTRVWAAVQKDGAGDPLIGCVALLHDTVEDSTVTLGEIDHQFGGLVAEGVNAMTKRTGESYDDYLARVMANPRAKRVKYHDMFDNYRRIPLIKDERTRKKLQSKYQRGFAILGGAF